MLGRPLLVISAVVATILSACVRSPASSSTTAQDKRTRDPCVSCTPESFCAGWSPPDDRRCKKDDDCVVAIARFPDVRCSFGWYGGAASAVASRDAEARVRARLSALDPCEVGEKLRGGSVCASPPLDCVDGLCGYRDAAPQIAY
ncbi:MAG: hypothetical protein KF850_21855 [Labilithrix sp.]|nr:hypothetical protein [Labilithrix sp.]